jgi:hypothetical protein
LTRPANGSASGSYSNSDSNSGEFIIDNPTDSQALIRISSRDRSEWYDLKPLTFWLIGSSILRDGHRETGDEVIVFVIGWDEDEEEQRVWSPIANMGDNSNLLLAFQSLVSLNLRSSNYLYCIGGQNRYSVEYVTYRKEAH